MANHYIYYSGGTIRIDKNIGATAFYVYTTATGIVEATGLPGDVKNFTFSNGTYGSCTYNPGDLFPIDFFWDPPDDTGGGTITKYIIREIDVDLKTGASGVINWSGDPTTIINSVYYSGLGEPFTSPSIKQTGSISCGIHGFQIAAVNTYGTGNYVNTGDSLKTRNLGWNDDGCASIVSTQNGSNTVAVTWTSGLVSCTGAYYQGEIRIYDNDTQTYTGVRLNSATPYQGTVNINTLSKNKYYYAVVTEYHYVGFIPTGCSEVVPECSRYIQDGSGRSNLFWYA